MNLKPTRMQAEAEKRVGMGLVPYVQKRLAEGAIGADIAEELAVRHNQLGSWLLRLGYRIQSRTQGVLVRTGEVLLPKGE